MAIKRTETEKDEIHRLTVAEINRQVRGLSTKRREAVEELIVLEKRPQGSPAPKPLDDHGRAVRERAISLLNGHAATVLKFPAETARENELRVEIDAIDIAVTALQKSATATRAADAVAWTEEHRNEWTALVREVLLAAVRVHALGQRAEAMLRSSPESLGIDLPLTNWFNRGALAIFERWDFENPLAEPINEAIADAIITEHDVRKSKNVQ
jgi:hypothetical protein